jgi:hypothetical protein
MKPDSALSPTLAKSSLEKGNICWVLTVNCSAMADWFIAYAYSTTVPLPVELLNNITPFFHSVQPKLSHTAQRLKDLLVA